MLQHLLVLLKATWWSCSPDSTDTGSSGSNGLHSSWQDKVHLRVCAILSERCGKACQLQACC